MVILSWQVQILEVRLISHTWHANKPWTRVESCADVSCASTMEIFGGWRAYMRDLSSTESTYDFSIVYAIFVSSINTKTDSYSFMLHL